MKVIRLIVLVVLFQPIWCVAAGLSPEQSKQFLYDSGLAELIASLPVTMEQQLDVKRLSANSPASLEQASQAVMKAASQVEGEKVALLYLSQQDRVKELSAALDFLASPLGQRIGEQERAASAPEAQMAMQAYAMQLAETPAPQSRNDLIQNLADSLNADKVVMQMMEGVFFSVLEVSELLDPAKAKVLKVMMENEWQNMEPQLSQQFAQFMIMGAHYSYRNLSDKDLSAYIEFLNSEPGKAYWRAGIDIIDLYMQGFVSELVAQLSTYR